MRILTFAHILYIHTCLLAWFALLCWICIILLYRIHVSLNNNFYLFLLLQWHLGQRPEYLPTNHGFDEWYGIPYHMSGGSIDDHVCGKDMNRTMWLPLYDSTTIIEQPVRIEQLAKRYVSESIQFMTTHANKTVAAVETTTAHTNTTTPFFLYLAFSHVHQLCAPRHAECQWSSSHFSKNKSTTVATFDGAVEEMDWIAGEIVQALRDLQIENNTIVLFTSDNGPWVGEQECSGKKGRFEGRWLAENVPHNCTACPSEYIHAPILPDQPRRCIYPRTGNDDETTNHTTTTTTTSYYEVDGIHCGQDTGLGSAWEANVRMPAFIKWPNGGIPSNTSTMEMVSTLDVVPTLLSLIQQSYNNNNSINHNNDTYNTHNLPPNLDGIDVSDIFLGRNDIKNDDNNNSNGDDDATRSSSKTKKTKTTTDDQDRVLFFWRDGFRDGPLPQPFGRFDVVAMKIGAIKVWFYTKSSHYNPDPEVYHDPPLLFDILDDPAEAYPLDPILYSSYIDKARTLLQDHKNSIDWTYPLCLERDRKYLPCANETSNCRTAGTGTVSSKSSSGRSSNYIAYNDMHNDPPLPKSDESAVT